MAFLSLYGGQLYNGALFNGGLFVDLSPVPPPPTSTATICATAALRYPFAAIASTEHDQNCEGIVSALDQTWPVAAQDNVMIDMTFTPVVSGGINGENFSLFIGLYPGVPVRTITGTVTDPTNCIVRFEFAVKGSTSPPVVPALTPGTVYYGDVYRTDTDNVSRVAHAAIPVAATEAPSSL